MELEVRRYDLTPQRTIGRLFVDGDFDSRHIYTLEDVVRPSGEAKVPGETAIPAGRYKVVIDYSPHFGRKLMHLLDVHDFEGIRVHTGNKAVDTRGCILVGLDRQADAVIFSRGALDELQPQVQAVLDGGGEVWCTVTNPAQAPEPTPA